MRIVASLAVALAMAVIATRPARACSSASQPHLLDPAMQAVDQVPPALPPISGVTIKRGQAPEGDGCGGETSTSCDDVGTIGILAEATDDMTPPQRIGYQFSIVAGSPPAGFTLPAQALEPLSSDGTIWLVWDDGATDDQDAIDVTFQVVAIDLAGNQSAPQTFRVQQGTTGTGCRLGPGAGARRPGRALLALAVGLLVAAARRSRRRV